jgi:hypothetical protein
VDKASHCIGEASKAVSSGNFEQATALLLQVTTLLDSAFEACTDAPVVAAFIEQLQTGLGPPPAKPLRSERRQAVAVMSA